MLNRWTRRELDPDGALGNTTVVVDDFMHDAEEKIVHTSSAVAARTHVYLHGPLQDQVLFDETDVLRITLGDHLNSVRDVVGYSGGSWTIVNHVVYDAFGARKSETNSVIEVFYGYTGRPYDEDTGLQNNLNRWYSADTGQWMSQDPIGFEGGDANLVRYVGNGPVQHSDPNGLQWGLAPVLTGPPYNIPFTSRLYTEQSARRILEDAIYNLSELHYTFSATLLSLFLEKKGGSTVLDLSKFSHKIANDDDYAASLRRFVESEFHDSRKRNKKSVKWTYRSRDPEKEDPAFATSHYSAIGAFAWSGGSDLMWALGDGHYGWEGQATLTILTARKCTVLVFEAPRMKQYDVFDFFSSLIREEFPSYRAGVQLEKRYGYPKVLHKEIWSEKRTYLYSFLFPQLMEIGRDIDANDALRYFDD